MGPAPAGRRRPAGVPAGHYSIPPEGELVTTWFSSGRGVVVGSTTHPPVRSTSSVSDRYRRAPGAGRLDCAIQRRSPTWSKAPYFQRFTMPPALL